MRSFAPDTIHILLVDDEPDFADTAALFLEEENERFIVETASNADAGLERLEDEIDCIVSDYDMPGKNGIDFLESVRAESPDIPFILYTGKGSEKVASDAISAGVTDYLQKETGSDQYTVLANRIENAVRQTRSQEALTESEQRLSSFIEQSPLGVIEWNENFNVVQVNDSATDILGYAEAELVGESWESIVVETDREEVEEVVESLLDAEGGYHSINKNQRKDGSTVTCEWHNRVITDDDGETLSIVSQFQDITERKERMREIQTLKERLELAVEGANLGVWDWDMTTDEVEFNEQWAAMLGHTVDEIEPHLDAWERRVHPNDLKRVNEAITAHRNGDTEYYDTEHRLRTADGDWKWIRDLGRIVERDNENEPVRAVGIHLDIDDWKTRERQLEALNAVTQELISADTREEVVEIGVETTRDLLGIEANGIYLYDDDAEELVPAAATDTVYDLVGEPPTFTGDSSIAWRVYQQGEALAMDDVYDDPDRYNQATPIRSELYLPLDQYGILIAGSPSPGTFDEQDVLMGKILAGGLVTALDQVEREQELRRQNERLDKFASVISHDLRNPLNVAIGRLDLAQRECASDYLDDVADAHDRMERLIDDVLILAREGQQAVETEMVDFAATVEGCWQTLETPNAALTVETEQSIQADPSRLQQLLENLFRNSVEHGSTSGRPGADDEVEHVGDDVTVTIGDLTDGFYVADDGPGIPEDERDHVFEAGYSTTEAGTGFGLNIVEDIVDSHGWDIHLTESVAGGVRFEITGIKTASK